METGKVYWQSWGDCMVRFKLVKKLKNGMWETSEGEVVDLKNLTTKKKAYKQTIEFLDRKQKVLDKKRADLMKIMKG